MVGGFGCPLYSLLNTIIMNAKKYFFFQTATKAAVTEGELTLTAVAGGPIGQEIALTIVESGTESTSAVTVSGKSITVAIGTSDDQTAVTMRDAINASADASALVVATSTGSTAVTAAVSIQYLALSETDSFSFPLSSFAGMQPSGDSALNLYFKSAKNFDGSDAGANALIISDKVILNLETANTHRDAMQAIIEQINSANGNDGLISFDDNPDDLDSVGKLFSNVGAITVAAANS